jgi:hypothetical protein
MNIQVAKNASGNFQKLLNEAKNALRQVERDVFHLWDYDTSEGGYENPSAALGALLQELHDLLLVVLEAAEMPETRSSLVAEWSTFTSSPKGLSRTDNDPEFDSSSSPALTFLERIIAGIQMSVVEDVSSEDAWTLSRLEAMLDDTAALVHRRGRPAREDDVQKIMHDYLSACFPDFRPNPPIGGNLKTFKPDCGIASVSAAIEFKIVHTKEEVAKAFSGIAEDTAGYKGSKDWTRFYAVIYQAQAFATKAQFRSDMKRIGATAWRTILVNGPTKKKPKKASNKKTPKKATSANKTRGEKKSA